VGELYVLETRARGQGRERAGGHARAGLHLRDDLVVAQVIRPHVSERVLVLERIHGQKVGSDHGLPQERASELARAFFRAYVHQVATEGVYHADPARFRADEAEIRRRYLTL